MKKAVFAIIIPLVLLSCAALNLVGKKPEVSLRKFDIDSITLKDITFRFDIELNNPYPIGFRLDDVGFDVKVEGSPLLKTRTKKGVTVAAGGSEITPISVRLEYESIMRLIKNYAEKDYLECVIDMDIVIPLPEMLQSIKKNITFKYTVQKKIPALKPSVKIANVQVTRPSLDTIKNSLVDSGKQTLNPENLFNLFGNLISGKKAEAIDSLKVADVPVTISFDVEVRNGTRARLDFRSLAYEFSVNAEKLIRGETKDIRSDGGGSVIRVTNQFSSKSLGASVLKMFTTRQAAFQLSGFSFIKLPDEIKAEPLRLDFSEKGEFRLK